MLIYVSPQLLHCLEQASWTLWGWEWVIFLQWAIIINFRACKGPSSWCPPTPSVISHCALVESLAEWQQEFLLKLFSFSGSEWYEGLPFTNTNYFVTVLN